MGQIGDPLEFCRGLRSHNGYLYEPLNAIQKLHQWSHQGAHKISGYGCSKLPIAIGNTACLTVTEYSLQIVPKQPFTNLNDGR